MPATESRRRRPTSEWNRKERTALGSMLNEVNNNKRRPRKRKLAKWERHELSDLSLLLLCLAVAVVIYTVRYRMKAASKYPSLSGVSKDFYRTYQESRKQVSAHKSLYDEVYRLATERQKPPDETAWPDYERRPFQLQSGYGPFIQHCLVTIVILQPKLGKPVYDYGPGQPLWFELESLGAFASDACVVLQTTSCAMKDYLGSEVTNNDIESQIINDIYNNSLPLFRRLIESGRVRLSLLDHHKYNLQSCKDVENPSTVFQNIKYWEQEFVEADSDMVLVFEEGSSLCYPLTDLDEYRFKALVGSVWPRDASPLVPEPFEGSCRGMAARWKNWLRPQRRWAMQQEHPEAAARHHMAPKPRELLTEEFPAVCENGRAPIGHGGLSLRSRKWMIQAIETCPQTVYSGLEVEHEAFACKVFEAIGDDLYFGTVLAGIRAPLPIAFEASLFATHMLWPEQVWENYGFPSHGSDLRSSWKSRRPVVRLQEEDISIPNGLFRPWVFHSSDTLRSEVMSNACPYLQYSFTDEMTEREDFEDGVKQWVGIGH